MDNTIPIETIRWSFNLTSYKVGKESVFFSFIWFQ